MNNELGAPFDGDHGDKVHGARARATRWLGEEVAGEDPRFLQEQIITYIGNKRSLLPFLGKAVEQVKARLGRTRLSILDLFSGTGIVARYLKGHAEHLVVNDLETYSRVANTCFLANQGEVDWPLLREWHARLLTRIEETWAPGFITELYAPKDDHAIERGERVFYTRRNATFLDTARSCLAECPAELQRFFLGPLLAEASVHANTSGVFKGFYKGQSGAGQFGGIGKNALARILGKIELQLPVLSVFETSVEVHQADANALVRWLAEVDLAYFDPPYNQHPYGSNYFMLNLLAEYQRPTEISKVSGIPNDWNRSRYNQRGEVEDALFDAIEHCRAKFLLLSYNSEGFVAPYRFRERLGRIGTVEILETPYNAFRGSRNLHARPRHVTEFLYLVERH